MLSRRRLFFFFFAGMEECVCFLLFMVFRLDAEQNGRLFFVCFVLFMVFRLDAEHVEKKANIGCLTIQR